MSNQRQTELYNLSRSVNVTSTYLVSIGYSRRTGELASYWRDGAVVVYVGPTQADFDELVASPNAGSLLQRLFKANKSTWTYTKVSFDSIISAQANTPVVFWGGDCG